MDSPNQLPIFSSVLIRPHSRDGGDGGGRCAGGSCRHVGGGGGYRGGGMKEVVAMDTVVMMVDFITQGRRWFRRQLEGSVQLLKGIRFKREAKHFARRREVFSPPMKESISQALRRKAGKIESLSPCKQTFKGLRLTCE
ncbi:hypothetical protein L6452_08842 [Arctium lappa]|uniref:Uncharacterized protein n=1 Tax=Arctium lappa TaxID=4217 RepID=A0ACB9DIB9_ARCLA|nr:hypothetical protein L6452_08842 [Arctium lappa]